jgi:predicted RNA-binding protein
VELSPELKSFRRKVNFRKVKETPLRPLIQHLSFIRNKKHWGFIFKLNLIQIPKEDFDIISEAMLI